MPSTLTLIEVLRLANYLMNILLVTPEEVAFPSRESVLFALLCGLLIGALPSLADVVVDWVRKSLDISEESEMKYLATYTGVMAVFLAFCVAALSLFGPSFEQRQEFFSRQIAELGYEQFFSLNILGVAIVLPIGVFRAYLRERANRKSEKIGDSTN